MCQRESESKTTWTCLSAASSSTCHLCPPSWCGWGPGGSLSLPASSLYPCTPPVPASHPDRTPPPETGAELPTQETWTPDRKQQKKKKKKKNHATPTSPVLLVMCGNCNVYLQVTLIRVPDPGAIFVKFLHHCHGDKRESRVDVGVLGIDQDSHFVHTRLDETGSQKSISQRWREMLCCVTAAVFCVRLYLCYCVESLQCTEELNTLAFV